MEKGLSMKSLRNVAVRMRPLASGTESRPDPTAARTDPLAAPAAPITRDEPDGIPAPEVEAGALRRNIWDIDPAPQPATPPAPARALPEETAEATQPRAARRPVTAEGAAGSARAKTRILGFHAQELEADGFALGAEPEKRGPVFPAGWLVVIDGPGRGAYFAVTTHVSTIGRGADQDVALDFGDMSISRSGHASVLYDGEQNRFFIGHGNKANVVRRNGQPVLATEEMFHGDMIRIGKTTLRFVALCGEDFTWSGSDEGDTADD